MTVNVCVIVVIFVIVAGAVWPGSILRFLLFSMTLFPGYSSFHLFSKTNI